MKLTGIPIGKSFRLGKDGKPKKIPKDASQKARWRGSKKVRVKRKGAE
jgi:hypothetical protein